MGGNKAQLTAQKKKSGTGTVIDAVVIAMHFHKSDPRTWFALTVDSNTNPDTGPFSIVDNQGNVIATDVIPQAISRVGIPTYLLKRPDGSFMDFIGRNTVQHQWKLMIACYKEVSGQDITGGVNIYKSETLGYAMEARFRAGDGRIYKHSFAPATDESSGQVTSFFSVNEQNPQHPTHARYQEIFHASPPKSFYIADPPPETSPHFGCERWNVY